MPLTWPFFSRCTMLYLNEILRLSKQLMSMSNHIGMGVEFNSATITNY